MAILRQMNPSLTMQSLLHGFDTIVELWPLLNCLCPLRISNMLEIVLLHVTMGKGGGGGGGEEGHSECL